MKGFTHFTLFRVLAVPGTALFLFAASPAGAEHLFMKSGEIVTGKIINENAARLTVRTEAGKIVTAERAGVMRILYANIYLGKQYVRLTDGRVIEAYMVDEDQESYTFRNELNSPEEFTVPRSKVLFFARSNPTNLEGTPDSASILLKWDPPYKKPKYYKVYLKQEAQPRYGEPVKVGDLSYRCAGLKPKTKYRIRVTAIDRDDIESLPSNEISLFTNILPPQPKVRRVDRVSKDGKELTSKLSWSGVRDRDGRIVKYNVYLLKEVEFKKVGDTDRLEYTVTGLDPKKKHTFVVRAVDDNGAESPYDAVKDKYRFSVMFGGYYAMPIGGFEGKLKPFLSFKMFADMDFFAYGPFFMGASLGGSYLLQKSAKNDSFVLTYLMASTGIMPFGNNSSGKGKSMFELTVWGLWGGINLGFRPARFFSIGVKALAGYARTEMVRRVMGTTRPVSNDPAFMAVLDVRFGMVPGVFVSILPAYSRVFYRGDDLSELHLGGAIGCQFDI